MSNPIRVLVVDDSAVVRGLISRWIDEADDIEITGYAGNGEQALKQLAKAAPDIILLDIEMPILDGLSIIPQIRKEQPDARIIMVSSLTVRHARETFKALTMGASDYLPKPSANGKAMTTSDFQRDLLEKIRALAPKRTQRTLLKNAPPNPVRPLKPSMKIASADPEIMVIGGSTGGPQALFTLFGGSFPLAHDMPVLITQHMPPTFTTIFAKHLESVAGLPAAEGQDGDTLKPGHIYVAPGDYHMSVRSNGGTPVLSLDDGPPVNYCRPAVDRLFLSAADIYGPTCLAIVLTGMGSDGCAGARQISEKGGLVVIQDEASSVVWGMPGAIAEMGFEDAQFSISNMAPGIKSLLARQHPATPHIKIGGGAVR